MSDTDAVAATGIVEAPSTEAAAGIEAAVQVRRGEFCLEVDVHVPAGRVMAVMGPNGSGKTTLLRCLAGLMALEAGHIALAGLTLDDPARGIWVPPERRSVAYAYQDVRLFAHLSVLDNVAFAPRCRGATRRTARRQALAALAAVAAEDLAGAKPVQLSGGQSQRVGLARALAALTALDAVAPNAEPPANPALPPAHGADPLGVIHDGADRSDPAPAPTAGSGVLLLDEPFSATDTAVRPQLRQAVRATGATVVLVTHDPTDAAELADITITLESGRAIT